MLQGLINLDLRPTAMNSHMKHTNWNSERTNFTNKKTTKRRSLPKPYTTPIRPSTRAANARSSALARGMGQDRPDQEMIGIFAEKPDEDRNLSTSIYAILWDNAIEHLEGVTWEASSWVEATPRRQAHLDMWNFRIYSGETVQVDDSVTRVWNLKVAIGFSIPALMEEQKRAERQVSRRQQLFKDIISLANEELRNDIFGMIDPHRFSYAAPLLDAHQTTASTMLQTLRIKMLTDGGHSKECKTTKFGFQPGCAQDPKPTVTRSAFDLLAPLLPASLPHSKYEYDLSTFIDDANFRNLEYKAAIFSPSKEKLLSRAGYYNASEDVKAFVKREHESPNRQAARKRALELSALVEQMIVDAPFLIGNRYFTVLAELVCGTATLRSLVNEIGINYPSNAFHVNRGYWLQAYHWSGRYGAYSQRQSERDFQMLRISFGVLKEADSESQCSS